MKTILLILVSLAITPYAIAGLVLLMKFIGAVRGACFQHLM